MLLSLCPDSHVYRGWPNKHTLNIRSAISRFITFKDLKVLLHWAYICLNVVTSMRVYTINAQRLNQANT